MEKNLAKVLIDNIGHDVLQNEVGLTKRNLRHIKSTGFFPMKWYPPVKSAAEARGFLCPLEAFASGAPAKKGGNAQ